MNKYDKRVKLISKIFGLIVGCFGIHFIVLGLLDIFVWKTDSMHQHLESMPPVAIVGLLFLIFSRRNNKIASYKNRLLVFGGLSVLTITALFWFLFASFEYSYFPQGLDSFDIPILIIVPAGSFFACLTVIILITTQLKKGQHLKNSWRE